MKSKRRPVNALGLGPEPGPKSSRWVRTNVRGLNDKRISEFRERINELLAGNHSIYGRKVPL